MGQTWPLPGCFSPWLLGAGSGLLLAFFFSGPDIAHNKATDEVFAGQRQKGMRRAALAFLLILVALLLAGTLKVGLLTDSYAPVTLPVAGANLFRDFLYQLVRYDAAKGEEGVPPQGAVLNVVRALIGPRLGR